MIVEIAEPSQSAAARRAAVRFALDSGFDDTGAGRIALVATEMATNLLKHAGGGAIVIQHIADGDGDGLELLSLDKGPGIADVPRALEDGFSTSGGPGTGLGAMRRQADRFAIYARPGRGTALMARFVRAQSPGERGGVTLGAVVEAHPGETEVGDDWAFGAAPDGPSLLMADGSGHGPLAAKAAQTAVSAFRAHLSRDPAALVEAIHQALRPTRGAAIALARIDRREKLVRFVGIGNITGATLDDGSVRRMVSHNGTAGHVAGRIREFTYPYTEAATVILHSDGLSAKWDVAAYPGLAACHPGLIAGVLFRDFRRGRDDASIVVMRIRP